MCFISSDLDIFLQSARRSKTEIENLSLEVEFLSADATPNPAEEGVYLSGLYLEGGRLENNRLEELEHSGPIYQKVPTMLCKAKPTRTITGKQEFYSCPIYTSSSRGSGQLVTTIKLQATQNEKHWSKRGVALLTHLDINC
jgi:dynein heavy chain